MPSAVLAATMPLAALAAIRSDHEVVPTLEGRAGSPAPTARSAHAAAVHLARVGLARRSGPEAAVRLVDLAASAARVDSAGRPPEDSAATRPEADRSAAAEAWVVAVVTLVVAAAVTLVAAAVTAAAIAKR